MSPRNWLGPIVVAGILLSEVIYVIGSETSTPPTGIEIGPKQVGMALFGPYLLGVEIASILLLAGIVGAYHLGRRMKPETGPDREDL